MSANRDRDEEIFDAARELAADERAAYLAERCGQDADLRQRIEGMLEADAAAGEFFKTHDGPLPTVILTDASLSPSMEKPGDRIGRYKLLQQIGEGGCGVVYMAEQEEPVRRRVALKVIKLGMDTKQVIARFEAERQALALMDHPNIARVLDAGATETGRPYFVMELVRGTKITEFCDQKELPTQERLDLFLQACSAIQHAHQKGIIHRDIKPSNILVTIVDGVPVPKVIDFGIAKATNNQPLTDKTVFTAFEQFIGTPAYMSPEQAELSGVDIDTRTDIYSLGVVLYELLTGSPPFDQKELLAAGLDEMRRTIRETEPPRPSNRLSTMAAAVLTATAHQRHTEPPRLVHQVRGDLDWIAMKCLEKDRARRYETANALAADIRRHLESEPVLARPPSWLYEFQKTVRRHKFGFAAATAVLLALALGGLFSTLQAVRATRAERQQSLLRREAQQSAIRAEGEAKRAEVNANEAQRQRQQAEALAEENRINLYAADIKLIDLAIKEGDVNHALAMLERLVPKAKESELRSFDWYYLSQLCRVERFSLRDNKGGKPNSVAFSPDGRLVAAGKRFIRLWDTTTGKAYLRLNGHQDNINGLAFSPDGKFIASVSDDKTLRLWEVSEGTLVRTIEGTNPLARVAFSPDGSALAAGEGYGTLGVNRPGMYAPRAPSGQVRVWDTHTWQPRSMLAQHCCGVRSLAFSPDGKKLASGGIDGRVFLHDVTSGELLAAQTNFPGAIGGVAFSADGSELAAASWFVDTLSGQIKFLSGDNLHEKRSINDEVGQVLCMIGSPDGTKLVSAGVDRLARIWDFASGKLRTKFQGHERAIVALAYSTDGKLLATSGWDSATKIWNAEDNPALRIIQTTNSDRVAFSPDGKILACANARLELRDAETGELIRDLSGFPPYGLAAYSPRGDVVAAVGLSDASVHFWDTQTGRHWMPSKTDSDPAATKGFSTSLYSPDSRLKFSSDGRTLVVPGFDGVIRFFETASGKLLNSIDNGTNRILSVAITADEKTLFTASLDRLDVWEISTRKLRTSFKEIGRLLQISKDQRWLASGSYEKGIYLRDLSTLQVRSTMYGHKETIYGITFSHDSRLLASASWDGTVKIWHVLSGRELMTIPSPRPAVSVAFAPDDRTLAFGTFNPGGVFLLRATERVTKSSPVESLSKSCDQLARVANWKDALEAMNQLIELEPTNHWNYHRLGPLFVALGDLEGYRQMSQRIKTQFRNPESPIVAQRVAKACLILPTSGVDPDTISRWMETALSSSGKGTNDSWNRFVKALAEYRLNHFADAAQWVENVVNSETPHTLKAQSCMVLAMARWQLKQSSAAQAALATGAEVVEQRLHGIDDEEWGNWIAAHALHREARQLIEGNTPADPFTRKP